MSAPKLNKPTVTQGQSFKVIGLGGVGGIVARYLTIFLAQQPARLVLLDGDSFEPANASRMLFNHCGNKAEMLRDELLPHLQYSVLSLLAIPSYIGETNVSQFIHEQDIVILAVDNHTTRKLVNNHCAGLKNVTLISGGNDGMDASHRGSYGNVQIYVRKDGLDASPSLTRYHPEIANPVDHHPDDKSCGELILSVPQVLFTNMLVATSILGSLWLYLSGALHYSEVAFDLADAVMNPVPIPPPKL